MRVRELRLAQGLSVQKLADLIGSHRRTIEDIERRDDCRVSTAILIAKALNVTMDELCIDSPS